LHALSPGPARYGKRRRKPRHRWSGVGGAGIG